MAKGHNTAITIAPGSKAERRRPYFALRVGECTAAGLRRIMLEQIDVATWHTRRIDRGDKHVHASRQANKRVRAVLRMVRDGSGDTLYRRDNEILRDVARDLSGLRSTTVRVETLEDLFERYPPLHSSLADFHSKLVTDANSKRSETRAEPLLVEELVSQLGRVRSSIEDHTLLPSLVPTDLGLRRTYRRGRRDMTRAYTDRNTEHYHEWRKRVKYLHHQLKVLSPVRPKEIRKITAGTVELASALGLDHDLADLEDAIRGLPAFFSAPTEQRELFRTIAARREELHTDLQPLAEKVYAQTPRDFAGQIAMYLEEWRNEPERLP